MSLYKALTGREFGDDPSPDEKKMKSLLEFIAKNSRRKKEPLPLYRKRLEHIKEMIEERIQVIDETLE